MGTEIKITFECHLPDDGEQNAADMEPFHSDDLTPKLSLIGFNSKHKGVQLLHSVLRTYLISWWGLEILPEAQGLGDIIIVNEDMDPVISATERRDTSKPFIILSSTRGSPILLRIASEHELIGGFCRVLYKPGGPSRLRAVLNLCMHALKIGSRSAGSPSPKPHSSSDGTAAETHYLLSGLMPRRNSENDTHTQPVSRPVMSRSTTAYPTAPQWHLAPTVETDEEPEVDVSVDVTMPTIAVGSGGTLLQSSVGSLHMNERRFKILVVEDNSILRNLVYLVSLLVHRRLLISKILGLNG